MQIRRSQLIEDSIYVVSQARSYDLKRKLVIKFDNELGIDYGGVSKEWFWLLSQELFDPYYGLFQYVVTCLFS